MYEEASETLPVEEEEEEICSRWGISNTPWRGDKLPTLHANLQGDLHFAGVLGGRIGALGSNTNQADAVWTPSILSHCCPLPERTVMVTRALQSCFCSMHCSHLFPLCSCPVHPLMLRQGRASPKNMGTRHPETVSLAGGSSGIGQVQEAPAAHSMVPNRRFCSF